MELKDLDTTQNPTAAGRYAIGYDGRKYVPQAQRYLWPGGTPAPIYGKKRVRRRRRRHKRY